MAPRRAGTISANGSYKSVLFNGADQQTIPPPDWAWPAPIRRRLFDRPLPDQAGVSGWPARDQQLRRVAAHVGVAWLHVERCPHQSSLSTLSLIFMAAKRLYKSITTPWFQTLASFFSLQKIPLAASTQRTKAAEQTDAAECLTADSNCPSFTSRRLRHSKLCNSSLYSRMQERGQRPSASGNARNHAIPAALTCTQPRATRPKPAPMPAAL